MNKAKKIATPVIAVLCVMAIVYLLFFFGKNAAPTSELTTNALKEYTVSFSTPELKYSADIDFMEGVSAQGSDNNDLTSFITVSCKPTKDKLKKTLTYSINKAGYKIIPFERTLVLDKSYTGPTIKTNGAAIEVPIDKVKNLSSIISTSNAIKTDDGFGNTCTITATLPNQEELNVGDYVATVTAQNIFGDTATAKITVTLTSPESSIIKLSSTSVTINKGDRFEPKDYVLSAIDETYGNVSPLVVPNIKIDTSKAGVYTIEYRIKDIKELENEVAYLYVTVN